MNRNSPIPSPTSRLLSQSYHSKPNNSNKLLTFKLTKLRPFLPNPSSLSPIFPSKAQLSCPSSTSFLPLQNCKPSKNSRLSGNQALTTLERLRTKAPPSTTKPMSSSWALTNKTSSSLAGTTYRLRMRTGSRSPGESLAPRESIWKGSSRTAISYIGMAIRMLACLMRVSSSGWEAGVLGSLRDQSKERATTLWTCVSAQRTRKSSCTHAMR